MEEGHRERLNALSEKVIGCAYAVSNSLGSGFLEKVYENALAHELRKNGIEVEQQYSMRVSYDGIVVGEFNADLLVEKKLLIELKAAKALDQSHLAQGMNYLKASGLKLCLVLNFGKSRVEIKRLVNNF
jgi:GxxExxY protein